MKECEVARNAKQELNEEKIKEWRKENECCGRIYKEGRKGRHGEAAKTKLVKKRMTI